MTYIILEKIYDSTGDHIANKEVWRGNVRPTHKLKHGQALMKLVKSGKHIQELAYPAAYGLSKRNGL